MARGKNLSEAVKAEIIRLSGEGKSGVDIGRMLSIEPSTVTIFCGESGSKRIASANSVVSPSRTSRLSSAPIAERRS